jgi:hypothetical protein
LSYSASPTISLFVMRPALPPTNLCHRHDSDNARLRSRRRNSPTLNVRSDRQRHTFGKELRFRSASNHSLSWGLSFAEWFDVSVRYRAMPAASLLQINARHYRDFGPVRRCARDAPTLDACPFRRSADDGRYIEPMGRATQWAVDCQSAAPILSAIVRRVERGEHHAAFLTARQLSPFHAPQ